MPTTYKLFDKNGNGKITDRTMVIISYPWQIEVYNALLKGNNPKKAENILSKLEKGEDSIWHMPLPNVINDQNATSWEGFGLTGAVQNKAEQGGNSIANKSGKPGNIIRSITSKATKIANKAVSVSGKAINPNSFLTFRENEPRSISLTYIFTPKDEEQMKIITNGFIALKKDMSPGKGTVLLDSPHIFTLRFGKKDSFLNTSLSFGLCVLTSMKVSYGADGNMAMFIQKNGDLAPKQTSLTLSFSEYSPKSSTEWMNTLTGVQ